MSACPWTWCSRRGGRGSRRWCTRTTPGSPLSPLSYPREPSLCRVKCLRVSLASVWNITTPEHFMLNLEFQFGLEGLCTVRSDGSDWLNLLRGDWLVYLQTISGDGEYGEYVNMTDTDIGPGGHVLQRLVRLLEAVLDTHSGHSLYYQYVVNRIFSF